MLSAEASGCRFGSASLNQNLIQDKYFLVTDGLRLLGTKEANYKSHANNIFNFSLSHGGSGIKLGLSPVLLGLS